MFQRTLPHLLQKSNGLTKKCSRLHLLNGNSLNHNLSGLNSLKFKNHELDRLQPNVIKAHSFSNHTVSRPPQAEHLRKIFNNKQLQTTQDLAAVRNEILETSDFINPKNIDALVIHFCLTTKNYPLAELYFDFLNKEGAKLSIGVIGKFFRMYYKMKQDNYKTKIEDEAIYRMYEDLKQSHKILDSLTGENVICGLSVTKYWKECLKILEDIKIAANPNVESYSLSAAAAFSNGEDEIGWTLFEELIGKGRTPFTHIYSTYLKTLTAKKDIEKLERLFSFFESHDIRCDETVAEDIVSTSEALGCKVKLTTVSPKGDCFNCQRRLQRLHLTNKEFGDLKEAFFKRAIIGKNVYNKTTPEEVRRFSKFVQEAGKFDVVIDGLNVAFSAGRTSPFIASYMILSVVKHFLNENKRVLVIGRKHMERWPAKNMGFINRKATVFLTENLSYDDPYLLYCALNSGMNTIIVTKDLMRGHLYLLDDIRHKRLFKKWLGNCQHQLIRVGKDGVPFFKKPAPYLKCAQKEEKYWHIPCESPEENGFSAKEKWVCLRT